MNPTIFENTQIFNPQTKRIITDSENVGDYLGVIVDNNDPEQEGRCKINVYGKFDDLKPEDLPWCFPVNGNIHAGGETKGSGQFFYPKVGTLVRVKFNNGDIYSPEYYTIENLNKSMKEEYSDSYVNAQILVFDEDEDLKILYTQSKGLLLHHKGSIINVDKNTDITIKHSSSNSIVQMKDGIIHLTSTDEIVDKSDYIYLDSGKVDVGTGADEPITRCESLFVMLKLLAKIVDLKLPTPPSVLAGAPGPAEILVDKMKPFICSTIASVAP